MSDEARMGVTYDGVAYIQLPRREHRIHVGSHDECTGQLLVDEGAAHCENCSGDCDDHDEPDCKPIYDLHLNLKKLLKELGYE